MSYVLTELKCNTVYAFYCLIGWKLNLAVLACRNLHSALGLTVQSSKGVIVARTRKQYLPIQFNLKLLRTDGTGSWLIRVTYNDTGFKLPIIHSRKLQSSASSPQPMISARDSSSSGNIASLPSHGSTVKTAGSSLVNLTVA